MEGVLEKIQQNILEENLLDLGLDNNPPEEISVEITQEELCVEIAERTNISVDKVKLVLSTFIKHQLETMKLS
jgi:hypothetical protein